MRSSWLCSRNIVLPTTNGTSGSESAVPSGLTGTLARHPTLKRWAILIYPSGIGHLRENMRLTFWLITFGLSKPFILLGSASSWPGQDFSERLLYGGRSNNSSYSQLPPSEPRLLS